MYPVSPGFLEAVRKSHTVSARVQFMRYGDPVGESIDILGGEITEDKTAEVRRTTQLAFSPSSPGLLLPRKSDYSVSPLWPVGSEVQVFAGIYVDGALEEVPMGVFRVTKPRLSKTANDRVVTVEGYDRSRAIARARFTEPYEVLKDTDYSEAIKQLMMNRMPMLGEGDFEDWMRTDGFETEQAYKTPYLLFMDQDNPWEMITKMARSFGAEVFFDGNGKPVLRPEPNPQFDDSVFDYVSGEEAIFDSMSRDLDDENTYNGVVAKGQNNDNELAVPRGEAWDTNPDSPTYYNPWDPTRSEYGPVPYFFTSDFITSDEQARAAADGMLLAVTGIMESVEFNGIANYAHQGGDVIRVKEEDLGIDDVYLLDAFRISLGEAGGMSGTTRRRRV